MENCVRDSNSHGEDGHSDLPPGFRFHPTDEELISQYLSPKTLDASFSPNAVGEVDLNKCEPWNLPSPMLAKSGTHEWYFFSVRDKKYPNGLRTIRATDAGYWKATGKDKDVHKGTEIVGLTLVFYTGRAPNGEKSNWIMHEYRLCPSTLSSSSKSEWVICRVYHKCSSGSGSGRSFPLMSEPPAHAVEQAELTAQPMMNPQGAAQYDNNQIIDVMQNTHIAPTYPTQGLGYYPVENEGPYPVYPSEISPFRGNSQYPYGDPQEMYLGQSGLENNNGGGMDQFQQQHGMLEPQMEMGFAASISSDMSNYGMGGGPFADQAGPSTSYEPTDIESFWNY